jgi:uncharacterized delta-60 repeat protein
MNRAPQRARRLLQSFCVFLALIICGVAGTLRAQTSPLDTNFKPPFFVNAALPSRVVLLPSGKFIVHFSVNALVEAQSESSPQREVTPITRYLPDGTRDTSFDFAPNFPAEIYSNITAVAPLAGDALYIAASQNPYGSNNAATSTLLHVNNDGTIDASFGFAATFGPREIRGITVQSDGKILAGGFFTALGATPRSGIARILANGTSDTIFNANAPQVNGGTFGGVWTNPALQPIDNKILIGGDFTALGSTNYPGIARLNPDGTLDGSFAPSGFTPTAPVRGIIVQPDGKIVLAGRFAITGGIGNAALIRLNSDGSRDTSFAQVGGLGPMKALAQQSDGNFVAVGLSVYRFNQDGSRDNFFRQPALLLNQSSASGLQGAFSVNVQADRKILIGGTFTDVDDEGVAFNGSRFGVARFNPDGTLDTGFTTSHQTGIAVAPTDFALQTDGTTAVAFPTTTNLVGTGFPFATIPHNFGRLGPNGSVDPTYDPLAQQTEIVAANSFIELSDHSFIVQGLGSNSNGNDAIRVLPDGTLANLVSENSQQHADFTVANGLRLPDGSILIPASDSTTIANGFVAAHFAPTGARDMSFAIDPQITNQMVQRSNGVVTTVATTMKLLASYSDGRVLFSYLATDNTYHLVRLQTNGSIDPSFASVSTAAFDVTSVAGAITDPASGDSIPITEVSSALGYADAEINAANQAVIVGLFPSFGASASKGIVRVNQDGSVDGSFTPGAGLQWQTTPASATFQPLADNIETQGDGKFIVTGTFEAFSGVTAPGIVRLNANGSIDNSFVAPASRNKYDTSPSYFKRQSDGSFLLSGPYTSANRALSPSFIHFFGPPVITSPLTASTIRDQQFVYQFLATGATSVAVNNLPPGLIFNSTLGAIVGNPNQAGTFQVGLSASNSAGATTATLTVTVQLPPSALVITSSTSATGKVGTPFSFQIITTGGSPATRVAAVNLPPGLVINPVSGVISGTPAAESSSAVNLTATDSGQAASAILQLTFTANPTIPVIISPSSALLTSTQDFSYRINAPATSDPQDVTIFTLIGTLPNGLFFDPTTGIISGTFSGQFSARPESPNHITLSGGIIGNVQIFATNSHGTSTIPLNFFLAPTGAVNIATRLAVGSGNNVLIAGFIITGNAPKRVIIRAIGPSLPFPGTLQDPTLELHDGSSLLGSDDNWRDNQENEIIATTIAPADNRESAIIATLVPGNYTAVVAGKDNTTGIAVVELYDLGTASLDNSSKAQLAQISTRGTVLGGDNVMIGGFIISGNAAKVIMRAIGPSLNGILPGALQDTVLELHDGSGSLVNSNDDWRSTQEQDIINTTVQPRDDRESAIVATLGPGNYTGVVRGKDGITGVALVEVYSLQ